MAEGGSAQEQAKQLRAQAAAARQRAESLEEQARRWEAGATGERLVAAELGRLPYPWSSLHDRLLRPGRSRTNLDHVVIGPSGIFLVDTKNWSGGVSEHDGTLWQHTGSSRSQRAAMEQVGRAAGEMERSLGTPVVPVIALAGPSTASFEPRRVGGIDVVPLHRLRTWLVEQPGQLAADDVELTRRRIDHAFPPATEPGAPSRHEGPDLTVDDLVSGRPSAVPRAQSSREGRAIRRSAQVPRHRRRTGRGASLLRGVFGLVLFIALVSTAPRLLSAVITQVASRPDYAVTQGRPSDGQPASRPLSCQDYPVKRLKAAVGISVSASTSNGDAQCSWFLGNSTSDSPELGIRFGPDVRIEASVFNSGQALATAKDGTAAARIGAGQHLRQWTDKSLVARDALVVHLNYRYASDANPQKRRKEDQAALSTVARLSEDFAQWMRSAT